MTVHQRRLPDVYFDEGLERWIKATAWQEKWRVPSWYKIEDLIQDGYICYCKCRNNYTMALPEAGDREDGFKHGNLCTDTPTVVQRKHFMALVQRAFYNHITTLANKASDCQEDVECDLTPTNDESIGLDAVAPPVPEDISLLVALYNAPAEIIEAIGKLIEDGKDGERYIRSRLRESNGRVKRGRKALRETTSQRLTRVLGDPDLAEKTKQFILS